MWWYIDNSQKGEIETERNVEDVNEGGGGGGGGGASGRGGGGGFDCWLALIINDADQLN